MMSQKIMPERSESPPLYQKGVILIAVLWIIIISLVMVSILAANVRLSAGTVMHQSDVVQQRADLIAMVNLAKMQLLIEKMPKLEMAEEEKKKSVNFNGQAVKLSYQYTSDIIVRIYDLSGLINLSTISREKFKQIMRQQMIESENIDSLLDAWQDWVDKDDLKRLNGAEKDYYEKKKTPYIPSNAPLFTVEELKLIKGFKKAFGHINLNNLFTLYGRYNAINPNIASKSTLLSIPGMTEDIAQQIIDKRSLNPFKKMSDFYPLFSDQELNKIQPWFSLRKGNYYAIVAYSKSLEESDTNDIYAYKELVKFNSVNQIPETLMIYPMTKVQN